MNTSTLPKLQKIFIHILSLSTIGVDCTKIKQHYTEEIEDNQQEEKNDIEHFKEIKRKVYIDINEYPQLMNILETADNNVEYPFILFIAMHLKDFHNSDLDIKRIHREINAKMQKLIAQSDKKTGRKVLIVVCSISSAVSWNDYFLSQLTDMPNDSPLFILACRVKNCAFCKKSTQIRRVTSYCGISIPIELWYHNLYYKNNVFNIRKTKPPYVENQVGIITAILNHGFSEKELDENVEED